VYEKREEERKAARERERELERRKERVLVYASRSVHLFPPPLRKRKKFRYTDTISTKGDVLI